MTQNTSAAEAQALQAVEEARIALAHALNNLRIARGQPFDEDCRACEGSGKDPLAGIFKSVPEDQECDQCMGSGRTRKVFPLIVTGIKMTGLALQPSLFKPGVTWVSIRPCDKAYGGKTFLGWHLGEMAMGQYAQMEADGTLNVSMGYHNPAIFVPDLGKVVYGSESWWAAIKSAEDLRKITDADINNVWYVRALQDLTGQGSSSAAAETTADTPTPASE